MAIDPIEHIQATFLKSFRCDGQPSRRHEHSPGPLLGAPVPEYLLGRYGGLSFAGGLYRLHALNAVTKWTGAVVQAFPNYKGVECFASDWLGRQFALSAKHNADGEPGVLMFEPGTGQVLNIPANFLSFHANELPQFSEAALARRAYEDWLANGGARPSVDECIGYSAPLFLGGADEIANMEKTDMAVYWEIMGQLLEQTRESADGALVTKVSLHEPSKN